MPANSCEQAKTSHNMPSMTPSSGRSAPYDPQILRERRCDAGLTQSQLAHRIGRTPALISALEAGTSGASPETLEAIATALGCRPADLRHDGLVFQLLPVLARAELEDRLRLCDACLPGLLALLAPDLESEDHEEISRRWDELVDAIATGRDPAPLIDALAGTDPQEHP